MNKYLIISDELKKKNWKNGGFPSIFILYDVRNERTIRWNCLRNMFFHVLAGFFLYQIFMPCVIVVMYNDSIECP